MADPQETRPADTPTETHAETSNDAPAPPGASDASGNRIAIILTVMVIVFFLGGVALLFLVARPR